MIKVENVSKIFTNREGERIHVLDEISFDVRQGEIVAIIGPNGSGKTTLLNIIAGIDKQTSGNVVTDCETDGVGFVFQDYRDSLFPWQTVERHIQIACDNAEDACEILKNVGLENHACKYPYQLSGGLSQLTAIARAIGRKPEVLLLDEPFASLDYQRSLGLQQRVNNLLERLSVATLIVTHSIEQAVFLADKIVVFSDSPAKVVSIIQNNLPRPREVGHLKTRTAHDVHDGILQSVERFVA